MDAKQKWVHYFTATNQLLMCLRRPRLRTCLMARLLLRARIKQGAFHEGAGRVEWTLQNCKCLRTGASLGHDQVFCTAQCWQDDWRREHSEQRNELISPLCELIRLYCLNAVKKLDYPPGSTFWLGCVNLRLDEQKCKSLGM